MFITKICILVMVFIERSCWHDLKFLLQHRLPEEQKVKVKNIRTTIFVLDKVKGIKSISACQWQYTKVKIKLWYCTVHVVVFTRIVNALELNGTTVSTKYFQYEKHILIHHKMFRYIYFVISISCISITIYVHIKYTFKIIFHFCVFYIFYHFLKS